MGYTGSTGSCQLISVTVIDVFLNCALNLHKLKNLNMLKRKLEKQAALTEDIKPKVTALPGAINSELFRQPLWMDFYEIECTLNKKIASLEPPKNIKCIYNPLEYAASLHCAYLRRFLKGRKQLMFIGMNPGPNGMGQTGVPFGNVRTVRDIMQLTGEVLQPPLVHPKRPVEGLNCKIEEPSGVRLWELFLHLAGGRIDTFADRCFVHNFCPLAFFDEHGHNITPNELKGAYKQQIRDICLNALEQLLNLVQPQTVVAVVSVSVFRLPHPSPRALNNSNWVEKASNFLQKNGLITIMRNEVKGEYDSCTSKNIK
ncbi:single-strand selective monofunctional uracil-DNA glycosylase isoform X2 [Drosophila nasuta]|uniref:single-strand selective monofunctional uracil-DNA glycosylase isoform X2 n=1 Tax=Drosophila nasuta TaxID=42062 RepID=UPI00295EB70E|nr:single-strand selective monofunctional uracil-DNA glycosylase isoform X2 [Drosophila nasuta]